MVLPAALNISLDGKNVSISWPSESCFVLKASSTLTGRYVDVGPMPGPPPYRIAVSNTTMKFFKLGLPGNAN